MSQRNYLLESEVKMKRVIIVGGGTAGLACAAYLKDLGFENVKILEAKERTGGRVYTKYFGSESIELGAEWIHGQGDNIIFDYANAKGLTSNESLFRDLSMKFCHTVPASYKMTVISLFQLINESADNYPDDFKLGTFEDFLNEKFNQFLNCLSLPLSDINYLHSVYASICRLLCEINGCSRLNLVSGSLLKNYKECGGDKYVEPKMGYSKILKLFLDRIPAEWIFNKKAVTLIDWSCYKNSDTESKEEENAPNRQCVKVHCADDDVYQADHVIVTVPLGYLKKHSKSLFSPSLSERKQTAIEAIGFETVNKMYLEYQDPFWEKSDVYSVFWQKSFDDKFLELHKGNKGAIPTWIKSINRIAYVPNHPRMLCAWFSGEGADAIELASEDEIMSIWPTFLELVIEKSVPKPKALYRSSWQTDPYTCGSYSYLSVDCERKNVSNVDLAEPEFSDYPHPKNPVIMFAGEATNNVYFSTVHGACETGIREAIRLHNYYKVLMGENVKEVTDYHYFNDLHRNVKIAVIGAGISGLSCAMHLASSGFTNVVLLEAQDHVGGRVKTLNEYGCCFELGAQWIHGTENELFHFANMYDLISTNPTGCSEGRGDFHTSCGKQIKDSVVEEIRRVMNNAKCQMESGEYSIDKIMSVEDFFKEAYQTHLTNCIDNEDSDIKNGLYEWFLRFEVVDNACIDNLTSIAVQSYHDWKPCPDDMYYISLKSNFSSLTDLMAVGLPENVLHLSTPVKNIEWNRNFNYKELTTFAENRSESGYPVSITCEGGEKMAVDCVVVTSSIGFLHENAQSFFTPSLPEDKESALKSVEFGTVNKIFLVYEQPFWNHGDEGFQLVWLNNKTEACKRLLQENPWVSGITGFDVIPQKPVLVGWIGGRQARVFEEVSEDQVSDACTGLLRTFLPCYTVPEPQKIFRSQWYSNPYIRGCYSSRSLRFYENPSSLRDLQNPICSTYTTDNKKEVPWPIMLFAGEASDETSFSSVHGAFRSGLTSAWTILKACSDIKVCEEIER